MVRALLAGTKTQTRRVVKGVKHFHEWGRAVGMVGGAWRYGSPAGLGLSDRGDHWSVVLDEDHLRRMCTTEADGWGAGAGCPYGQPSDRLWVRETWYCDDYRVQRGPYLKPDDMDLAAARSDGTLIYRASSGDRPYEAEQPVWRPSIHMPRWASRITLEVTGVRVERLQDISRDDAIAEGVRPLVGSDGPNHWTVATDFGSLNAPTPQHCYELLWNWINGPESWDQNPWVWVVEFKRLEAA